MWTFSVQFCNINLFITTYCFFAYYFVYYKIDKTTIRLSVILSAYWLVLRLFYGLKFHFQPFTYN